MGSAPARGKAWMPRLHIVVVPVGPRGWHDDGVDYLLAQVNIGRMLAPLDSPQLADFVAALDPVNAAADAAPGFVWRRQTEDGNSTAEHAFGWDRTGILATWVSLPVAVPMLGAMADSRLSLRDRELFLAEPHIAALSVSAGPDRGPLTVPIWYQYEPGGEAWVLTEAASRKARLIEAAGRFTLMVERVTPTVRYVSVEGPVTRTIPGTDELLREITERYLPPEKVPANLEFARTELGEQVAIYLRPQRWLSADLGPG